MFGTLKFCRVRPESGTPALVDRSLAEFIEVFVNPYSLPPERASLIVRLRSLAAPDVCGV